MTAMTEIQKREANGAAFEYTTRDKSTWGEGPWQNEPDKVQWLDEASGLDCLLVRGPAGAWCGYVGVSEGHPYFGVEYNHCAQQPKCEESWCGHSPESVVEVHGGLTFSDPCHEPTRQQFDELRASVTDAKMLAEVRRHPNGDYARQLARAQKANEQTYEEWEASAMAERICHRPVAGRPDRVWWLGFDCAHSGDFCPAYAKYNDGLSFGRDETYKTRRYSEAQTVRLAAQLASLTTRIA